MANNTRFYREKIYRQFICKQPLVCDPTAALQLDKAVKTVPLREKNFQTLVAENFHGTGLFEDSSTAWPPNMKSLKTYKYLHEYALTGYGSVTISKILALNKKTDTAETRYGIGIQDNDAPHAGFNFILFPSNFPMQPTYSASGQLIDPLATIHHELAHTRLNFRKSIEAEVSPKEEREAVMYFENPVRMLNGFEPRYTYTEQHSYWTINIISGEVQEGVKTFSPNNPAVLIKK